MHFDILETILSVLITALVITVLFRRLHLPVVLGYFLVGALMGPNALGYIPDVEMIKHLSEFGIVFLMFTVGLEFSQPQLFALKYSAFVMGSLQVFLCSAITIGVGLLFKLSLLASLVTGGIIAMSSTAIVIKQLNEQLELHSTPGLNAVGILLFQDLAVIPFVILIVGLAENPNESLAIIFMWALLKGILAFALISISGRWILRPLFHIISATRAIELFTLTVLLITLTAAWLTNKLGLSYALGAFLAGIMLAETEFRHQIEIEIRPFRDILLGLFFISIGMLADVKSWGDTWQWILLLVTGFTLGKMLVITFVCRISGNSSTVALRTGLILGQGGEFGFAILALALNYHMLSDVYSQIILASLLISMAISPIFIIFNKSVSQFVFNRGKVKQDTNTSLKTAVDEDVHSDHIIICGYGRVGQHVARILRLFNFSNVCLDMDSQLVKSARMAGESVIYGDAIHSGILAAAGLDHAKALIISFNDLKASLKIMGVVKQINPTLPIIVRCTDHTQLKQLRQAGATTVVAEIFEESLSMAQHVLETMDVSHAEINDIIKEIRHDKYEILHKVFSSNSQKLSTESPMSEQLQSIHLGKKSYAVNKMVKDFAFQKRHIDVIAIRRGKTKSLLKPKGPTKFLANDIIIVYGSGVNIKKAEKHLLEGL